MVRTRRIRGPKRCKVHTWETWIHLRAVLVILPGGISTCSRAAGSVYHLYDVLQWNSQYCYEKTGDVDVDSMEMMQGVLGHILQWYRERMMAIWLGYYIHPCCSWDWAVMGTTVNNQCNALIGVFKWKVMRVYVLHTWSSLIDWWVAPLHDLNNQVTVWLAACTVWWWDPMISAWQVHHDGTT